MDRSYIFFILNSIYFYLKQLTVKTTIPCVGTTYIIIQHYYFPMYNINFK